MNLFDRLRLRAMSRAGLLSPHDPQVERAMTGRQRRHLKQTRVRVWKEGDPRNRRLQKRLKRAAMGTVKPLRCPFDRQFTNQVRVSEGRRRCLACGGEWGGGVPKVPEFIGAARNRVLNDTLASVTA